MLGGKIITFTCCSKEIARLNKKKEKKKKNDDEDDDDDDTKFVNSRLTVF